MTTLSNFSHYSISQKVARTLGEALVNWAERAARRSESLRPDPEVRVRRVQQRREAEARRESAIAGLHLGPRPF